MVNNVLRLRNLEPRRYLSRCFSHPLDPPIAPGKAQMHNQAWGILDGIILIWPVSKNRPQSVAETSCT